MEMITIRISKELKEKIASFGTKGESYETIIKQIYAMAVKEQLRAFLISSKGFVTIKEAIKEVEKKWPRSK